MEQEDVVTINLSDFPKPDMSERDKPNYYNPVNEYTLEGVYVKTWKSPAIAERAYGLSKRTVYNCCKGCILCIEKYGKIFLYKGDSIVERLKAIQQNINKAKASHLNVEVYNKSGKWLSWYPSLSKTSDKYHIAHNIIRECCQCKRLFVKDYIFLFEGGNIKERLKLIKQKEKLDAAIEKEILKND